MPKIAKQCYQNFFFGPMLQKKICELTEYTTAHFNLTEIFWHDLI